ncbi:hypothetical protein CAI21_08920 [Alkalilimnicola ehrlichii]|uniref:Uncharacterized protein n=1 Tax=Alkalilimnicola ehrlichii TaxID=351052 RepID=A0A3E0WWH1_9GAMM|nr:hypothetical protein CAI21_08920 [Alkalilimnicola ehrlichii]RFA36523.1 hypothetical protein CAL65_11195 [Alkalilimnicola ehrlichii]
MKYIAPEQLGLHLRLGRSLAQFIRIGQYFESKTFDWVTLTGTEDQARITLVRSRDEGAPWFCDVAAFTTVAEDDPSEELHFTGSLEECLVWLESELGGSRSRFLGPGMIDDVYSQYVAKRDEI